MANGDMSTKEENWLSPVAGLMLVLSGVEALRLKMLNWVKSLLTIVGILFKATSKRIP